MNEKKVGIITGYLKRRHIHLERETERERQTGRRSID